jgi:secreted PhoX family phosphatase
VVVPEGYQQRVVIGWGDPVLPGAPVFDVTRQSGAAQRQQFGFNNDFAALLPVEGQAGRFLLVVNHEYNSPQFMFPSTTPGTHPRTVRRRDRRAGTDGGRGGAQPAGRPATGDGPLQRRITADTPFTLTGPAAGADTVRTTADPTGRTILGTFANCAGGVTPWGTVLSGEENFHSYFGTTEGSALAHPEQAERYGVAAEPSEHKWEAFDPRFDLTAAPTR